LGYRNIINGAKNSVFYDFLLKKILLGKLTTLSKLNWKPHEEFILSIENTIPLDREMITPKDLSEAHELELVFSNY